jgi:alpha-beta hydrolase superfamily lysophospholipase
MSAVEPAVPLYLDGDVEGVFALFNAARAGRTRKSETAVLICPPFGWDLLCSYRARRDWAEHLAARGHPTMRIDLPGTGDSAGLPSDPARLDAWTQAVCAAALSLRRRGGARRLVAVGVGLGGMVAYRAACAHAAIDDLVLWGVPARGHTLVRELRALSRLSSASVARPGDADCVKPPAGAVLAAGYLLSAETAAALEQLDISELMLPDAATRRVLLLGRGGARVDERLRPALEQAGASVTVADGQGRVRIGETFATVDRWLAEDRGSGRRSRPRRARARQSACTVPADTHAHQERLTLTSDGAELRESVIWIEHPRGRLFGVLAEPLGPPRDLCMVLLNAGPQRHIGPNRMWVEIARRWAARGVPSLRIDLSCIGDSDGDAGTLATPGALYAHEYVEETLATLQSLSERGLPERFVLVGLCSGAYWALHASLRDERVAAVVMLNPRRLLWDERLARARPGRRLLRRLSRRPALRRLLGPAVARARFAEPAGEPTETLDAIGRLHPLQRIARSRRPPEPPARLDPLFDALHERGQRALLMLTGSEPLHEQLAASGALDGCAPWPALELVTFETPAETHTLAPLWLQREIHHLIDTVLGQEIERAPARAPLLARSPGGPNRPA